MNRGTWRSVVQAFAETEHLRLGSFILKSLSDVDVFGRMLNGEIGPWVKSEDILHLIHDGVPTPFAQRQWVPTNLSL
jgi:hypothetical protein